MSESLKELEQVKANLLATEKKIQEARKIEAVKQLEAKTKRDAEQRKAKARAFVARQDLINLEATVLKHVKLYAGYKKNHIKNDITDKWDAFLADLKGEKKPRKKRTPKTEE